MGDAHTERHRHPQGKQHRPCGGERPQPRFGIDGGRFEGNRQGVSRSYAQDTFGRVVIEDSVSHAHLRYHLTGIYASGKEIIGEKAEGSGGICGYRFLHRFRFHKGFTYGEMGYVYS